MTIKDICSSFSVSGKYVACKEIPTGNINSTYDVSFVDGQTTNRYIVQRINKKVFCEPEKVMDNIVRVTKYVSEKIQDKGLSKNKFVLHVLTNKVDGKPFVIDDEGEYWRCYDFIPNAITYDATEDLTIIERAGCAFGKFQNYLEGFDASTLHVTIPKFHDTIVRFSALHDAVKLNPYGRAEKVKEEIEKCFLFEERATELQRLINGG